MESEWELQVSRTFLSILCDFNNAVVWMISILYNPPVYLSSFLWPFQMHQLQLVSPLPLCPKAILILF